MTLPPKSDRKQIKKIYAVGSGKGGVGKSSVTSLLAVAAARAGKKVGILDADITGPSIPTFFGLKTFPFGNAEGIEPPKTGTGIKVISMNLLLDDPAKPVVWRGPLLGNAVTQFFTDVQWDELDVLFIDLPPGTADAVLTVMQTIPLDGFLLVTSPPGDSLPGGAEGGKDGGDALRPSRGGGGEYERLYLPGLRQAGGTFRQKPFAGADGGPRSIVLGEPSTRPLPGGDGGRRKNRNIRKHRGF
jgi:hypothetical protein